MRSAAAKVTSSLSFADGAHAASTIVEGAHAASAVVEGPHAASAVVEGAHAASVAEGNEGNAESQSENSLVAEKESVTFAVPASEKEALAAGGCVEASVTKGSATADGRILLLTSDGLAPAASFKASECFACFEGNGGNPNIDLAFSNFVLLPAGAAIANKTKGMHAQDN